MLEFRVKNIVPPGGAYFFEVDGVPLHDATRTGLRTRIARAYAAKGEQVPIDIEAQIMHFMCLRLPEGFCMGAADGSVRNKVLTIQALRTNTENLVRKASGMAPPTKAKFNARRCNQCSLNNRSMCPTCSGINAWASRRVGRPETPAEYNWLGVCTVDGTALAAKVNLEGLPNNNDYPSTCWVTEDNTHGG